MDSRTGKNRYSVILACRRGLFCLSLICALIIQPYTVLANDSSAQVDSADASAENNTADPADAAAQDKAADPSEVSRDLKEDRKEEVNDDGMQADSVTSVGGEDNRDSAPEADGIEIKADANANVKADANANVKSDANANANTDPNANAYANTGVNTGAKTSASDDGASVDYEGKQDSVTEADGSEDNAVSYVNTNADEEVPGDGMTGDDRMTDHADTEITKASTPALQSEGDSLTASAYPSSFDLRDRGGVTPVKLQSPWGT